MKKKMIVFITLMLSISLIGCSSSKLNANNTRTAKAIINAVDDYLNGEVDAATTYDLVNAEEDNIDENDENSTDRLNLSIYTSGIITELIGLKSTSSNLSGDAGEIEENRNKIAGLIGESKINTGARKSSSEDESYSGIVRSAEEAKAKLSDFVDIPAITMTFADHKFEYPEDWTTRTSDDGRFLYLYPTENPSDGMVMFEYETVELGNATENMATMGYNILHDDVVVGEGESKSITINSWFGEELVYTQVSNNINYATDACLIPNGDVGVMYAGLIVPEDSTDDFSEGFLKIIFSMEPPAE